MVARVPAGRLLVAGHVNVDRFLRVARAPGPDRTVPVLAERTELGGTATNLARVARRLGVEVGLFARVGDGFPPAFWAGLRAEGIDLRGVERVRGAPTPTCTIIEDDGGTTRMLMQQGPMGSDLGAFLRGSWWKTYRWFHLGTGDPRRTLRLARAASGAGRRVAFDPAQEVFYRWDGPSLERLLPSVDLLFGNRAELDRIARALGLRAAERLVDRLPLVVRTEGPDGASAFFRGGSLHAPSARPRTVRTLVGAGDAFRGGFYAAWFAGARLSRCLAGGNRAARAWIEGRR
jgi:sugar/nucleoside kinase (ribokinase family)